jgi:hypothetical protein
VADPMHVEDLEALCCPCGSDTCKLSLSAKCHPKAGATVVYRKDTATLVVLCGRCEAFMAEIAVAKLNSHTAGPVSHGVRTPKGGRRTS